MHKILSKKSLDDYRRARWYSRKGTFLSNLDQAAKFLDDVGMCLLFACRDIPLPKICDLAADDTDWWSWKDALQEKKLGYVGRIVRRKATLVSMKLLPFFYCVYLNGGGYTMYEEEYFWGKLGELANKVAQYLDRNGPTPTDILRLATVPPGKANTRRFHSALFELQSKFKIVTVGLKDKSWGVRVLDLFSNWIPHEAEQIAESWTREEAIQEICTAFLGTAGAVPENLLPRLFAWTASDISSQIDLLVAEEVVRRGRVRGESRTWLLSSKL